MIVLNYKVYPQSFGENGLLLSRLARDAAYNWNKPVFIAPPCTDLVATCRELPQFNEFKVFAQHADACGLGAHTGSLPLKAVKEAGASGVVLNHSERKLKPSELKKSIALAKKLGLLAIACAGSLAETRKVASMRPWAVAFEPPDLIGSGVSVTTRPKTAKNCIAAIKKFRGVKALVGAGVSKPGDVRKSLELGAEGVLLASAFVKAKNPKAFLQSMVKELK